MTLLRSPRLRRYLLLLGATALLLWIAFFDSHSLWKRAGYFHEARTLQAENARLEAENAALEHQLEAPLSDETVERIAREQYGMRKAGETVYRVAEED